MRFTFGKKFKASTLLARSCLSVALVLLVLVGASHVSANTGTVHLSSAYNYRSVTYNTYVKWAGDLYGDYLNYGVGSDSHINFTNFSMDSANNPSWTFGVVSQNGNVTISAIQTNYIRFSAMTKTSETLNMTFYYISLPAEVDIAQPTNTSISSSSYYTTYSSWVAAAAPAVYNDAGSNYLMVKSTYSTPVIQITQATATTSSSTSKTTTSTSTSTTPTTTTTSTSKTTTSTSKTTTSTSTSTTPTTTTTSTSKTTTSTSSSAASNFIMTISPSSGTVVQGADISAQVHVSPVGKSVGTVFLSVSNPIPGAHVTIFPSSGVPSFSSELSIHTSRSTQVGSYRIEVTGIEHGVLVTSTYVLTVTPATRNASGGPSTNSLFGPVVASAAVVGVALAVVVMPRASQLGRRLIRSGFTSHPTNILLSYGWDIVAPDRPVT